MSQVINMKRIEPLLVLLVFIGAKMVPPTNGLGSRQLYLHVGMSKDSKPNLPCVGAAWDCQGTSDSCSQSGQLMWLCNPLHDQWSAIQSRHRKTSHMKSFTLSSPQTFHSCRSIEQNGAEEAHSADWTCRLNLLCVPMKPSSARVPCPPFLLAVAHHGHSVEAWYRPLFCKICEKNHYKGNLRHQLILQFHKVTVL